MAKACSVGKIITVPLRASVTSRVNLTGRPDISIFFFKACQVMDMSKSLNCIIIDDGNLQALIPSATLIKRESATPPEKHY